MVIKRDGRWVARVSRQVDGKQREISKRFRLWKNAVRWEREQKAKIERGEWVQPTKMSLNALLDIWLAGLHGPKQRTREHYRVALALYIRPALGTIQLDQLSTVAIREALAKMSRPTPRQIEKYNRAVEAEVANLIAGNPLMNPATAEALARKACQSLEPKGLSPRTVAAAHGVLRLALNTAVEDRLLLVNPAAAKRMTLARDHREQQVLTRDEVRTLLTATEDQPLGPLWNLLVYTGLRPGEALGLQWPDLDLTAKVVRVRRALVPQKKGRDGRTWRLEDPKTEKSRRAVPLLPTTVEALTRHRDRQAVERLVAGERYAEHGFVFATPIGEPLRGDVLFRSHFRRALKQAGLPPVTLYALRHTAATLMLEAGIVMKVVQERLGHSTMALTADTYSHVSAALQEQAMEQLAQYI